MRNIGKKKIYVAVEDPKLHKIDRVNFFLQYVFFPKQIKNQKFWNRKLIHWRLRHDPTYVPNCRTLKESRKICCRILGFHRLITSEHSTHTHHDAQRSPHDFLFPSFGFVFEFCVCCRVLGFHRLITSEHSTPTHTTILDAHPTIFRFWVSRGPIFRGPFFRDSTLAGILKSRVNAKSLFVMLQYVYKRTIDRYANLNS